MSKTDDEVWGWQLLEEYLVDVELYNQEFNSVAVAEYFDITRHEASMLIQAYQDASRRPNSQALFSLNRQGRTSSARWYVGANTKAGRQQSQQLFSDVKVKVRHVQQDLRHMVNLNPRCGTLVTAITGVLDANLLLLEAQIAEE